MRCSFSLCLALLGFAFTPFAQAQDEQRARRVERFDAGWKFHLGDLPGAQAPDHDDRAWRSLDLPHDWSIEGPYDQKHPGGALFGFLPGGVGWYRKTFDVSRTERGRKLSLQFDGIYENGDVWINGTHLGRQGYGYTSFVHELTPHLRFDAPNVVAVRVDNSRQPNSRWYSGSGIYRHTWLISKAPVHIGHWGTYVTTPTVEPGAALVRARITLRNEDSTEREVTLTTRIIGPDGREGQVSRVSRRLAPGTAVDLTQDLNVPAPRLWSPETPTLYTLDSRVESDGRLLDSTRTSFGIRTIAFDKDRGFLLNGESVKFKGVCLHQDGGSVGVAVPVGVWERRLRTLREMGCNAIRVGHHPPAPEFLDLCDRLGFLVINEAFDKWDVARYWKDYNRHFAQDWEADLVAMLRRDRNHPSIVLWSVGNENGVVWTQEFFDRYRALAEVVRREDPTRPVTAALRPIAPPKDNRTVEGLLAGLVPMIRALDVVSLNYQEHLYEEIRRAIPEVVIVGTESYGYFRGEGLNHKSANDNNPWFDVVKNDYVAGQFLWPGIDYLGESTGWPAKGRGDSPIETTGFRKPRSYWHESVWSTRPMVHIAVRDDSMEDYPQKHTWHWPAVRSDWTLGEKARGRAYPVLAYSNCESVELVLNGRSLGRKKPADFKNLTPRWDVPFEPGEIRALGRKGDTIVAEHRLRTAGEPATLRLIPDKATLRRDGLDVVHVEVRIEDAEGTLVPDAALPLEFSLSGPARIIGLDNGDLRSEESFKGTTRRTWRGRCLVIIQSGNNSGEVSLEVKAKDLPAARIAVN